MGINIFSKYIKHSVELIVSFSSYNCLGGDWGNSETFLS